MNELLLVQPEQNEVPRYRIMITRHAERLPSGELSSEGIAHAAEKGSTLGRAEVLKGYASNHPSGRAYDTAEAISQESGVLSQTTGKYYQTRKVEGISYDVLGSVTPILNEARAKVDKATMEEISITDPELASKINLAAAGSKTMTRLNKQGEFIVDLQKLPTEFQGTVAKIRQRNQPAGFRYLLDNPEFVQAMAQGLAHQIADKQQLVNRYAERRETAAKPPAGDVVVNLATHGMFMESMLHEAGILERQDGTEQRGIRDFEGDEFGGFIQPAESMYLELENPHSLPERIPVSFEGDSRPKGRVFIDREKLLTLAQGYRAAQASKL